MVGTTAWLLWLPPALVAVATYVLGRAAMTLLVDVGRVLAHRRSRGAWRRAARVARPTGGSHSETTPADRVLRTPTVWLGLGGGLLLAALWHHAVLSPWCLLLGGAAGWMVASTGRPASREDLQDLETFIGTLRSVFTVGQSVFVSLEAAGQDLPEGELRTAVMETVRRYRADLDADRALGSLRGVGSGHLSRLAVVLAQVGCADEQTTRAVLLDLEEQVRCTRRLRDRTATVLTLSRLTLRVLQGANLMALGTVTLVPMWRAFYTGRPLVLVAATGMALAGSWYFAAEMQRMEDLV